MDAQAAKSGTSKPKKSYEDVKQGIKQLYPSEDSKTATNVDIVFVPGLGADPEASWKSTTGEFNWSSDKNGIAKDYPNARVLLYQHESAFHGPLKVEQFIDNLAKGLLHGLSSKRAANRDDKTSRGGALVHRPLVFIGHSMGGLVIAKAVVMMDSLRTTFPKMLEATVGCFFFGSPFRGAAAACIASMVSNIAEKFDLATKSKLLDLMKPDSTELLELRSDFLRLVNDLKPEIELFCFWEEQNTDIAKSIAQKLPSGNVLYGLIRNATGPLKVVDRDSATFGDIGKPNLGLACNHRDLVKFSSFRDSRYDLIRDPMRKIIHNAPLNAKNRLNSTRNVDLEVIKSLSEVLGVESISRKRRSLEQKFTASSWLPTEPEFLSWLSDPEAPDMKTGDSLYVRGQQGRGKTGAMISALEQIDKFISLDKRSESGEGPILLAYYFCDAQSESSAEDILKSMLWQLIQKQYLFASYAKQFTKRDGKKTVLPSVENLWQSLQDMLTDTGACSMVYFLINNVHSLPEESASTKKLLELIKDELTTMNDADVKRVPTRWFFTSRSEKINIEENLRVDGVRLIDLEDEKYANQVQLELRRHAREMVAELGNEKNYKRDLAYFVSSLIGARADTTGWIDITCNQLKELPETESANKVRQTLKSLPQSLDNMLDEAWQQVFSSNATRAEDLKEMLRCLVLTYEDPTLMELAILTGLTPDEQGADELRDLIGKCPSFLVLDDSADPKVSFKNNILKPHLFRHVESLLGLSPEEMKWQHGELALRSFAYVLEKFDVPEPEAKQADEDAKEPNANKTEKEELEKQPEEDQEAVSAAVEDVSVDENEDEDEDEDGDEEDDDDEDDEDDDDGSDQSSTAEDEPEVQGLAYMVKHFLHHASKGTVELAEELSRETIFWESGSKIRQRWLTYYDWLKNAFDGVECDDSLTALHVAASIGFNELVKSLIKNGHENELSVCDSLDNTPLHLAAFFGRKNIVEQLLFYKDVNVDEGIEKGNSTPLGMAAFEGNIKVMQVLLDGKANPNAIDTGIEEGSWFGSVLVSAISSGSLDAVKLLVERGAAVSYDPDSRGGSPLEEAAGLPDRAIFDYLLESADDLRSHDYDRALVAAANAGNLDVFSHLLQHEHSQEILQEALVEATDDSNYEIVRILLKEHTGLDCNALFEDLATNTDDMDELLELVWEYANEGSNPDIEPETLNDSLYEATDKEKESTVRLLLETCRADANATGEDYGNALTAAAYDGTTDIVKLLLDNGADVNSENGWALQTAAGLGHFDVVNELLARGADVNACAENDYFSEGTALQCATEAGDVKMVELLLDHGASPDRGGGQLTCPIIAATCRNEPEILRLLIKHGVKVDVNGREDNTTPLILSGMYMTKDDIEVLLKAGADINLADPDGDNPLIIATMYGEADAVECLLEKGADVMHVSHSRGINALQAALAADNHRCLELLINHVSKLMMEIGGGKKGSAKGAIGEGESQNGVEEGDDDDEQEEDDDESGENDAENDEEQDEE